MTDLNKKVARSKSKTQARRSTRSAGKKKQNAGGGRPKGSKISKTTGLTPRQEEIAQKMLEAELASGMFPASVREIVDVTGADPKYVRGLLKRPEFQKYLQDLLSLEGVVLESAFWRSMALGLQVGDPKVMQLYANMTGKLTKKEEKKVSVEIKGVGGEGAPALPDYAAIEEAEVVDE